MTYLISVFTVYTKLETVSDYEIVAIANYFHISTDYLLGLTDTK